jgi:hypothetical protein
MALEQKLCKINLIWALYHNLVPVENIFRKYTLRSGSGRLLIESKSYVPEECKSKLFYLSERLNLINLNSQIILNTSNLTYEEYRILDLYGLESSNYSSYL